MKKQMSLVRRASRRAGKSKKMPLANLVETLETRRLLSLSIDMRIDVGNAANNDPSSIVNAHTISNPQVGDVYAVQVWAVVTGADSDSTNDYLDFLYGSLLASNLRTGGYFGAVKGTFAVPALEPYFASSTYESDPGVQYTDANGNVDIGSITNQAGDGPNFFHPIIGTGQPPPPTNPLNSGQPGAGEEQELAATTFTVTSIASGPPTALQFVLRPQVEGEVSALWFVDGQEQDTLSGDTVDPSTGIIITTPDTIAPTASATLSPILGGTSAYQFTVDYSDNQDLNTTDFGDQNILVTGPNGYSQYATYVGDTDANPSSESQYDPYDANYQITPPDGTWDIADNGQYTFTLEPNQIADNSGNYAGSAVLGGGPLDADFLGDVSISPSTAETAENSGTPATFTVTRTDGANDDFAEPMTVDYSTSGSAAAGTNYTALTGSVTILAGQASATISVQPLDDQTVDPSTTLDISLTPGSSYVLASQTTATLTIDNTDLASVSISPATSSINQDSATPATFTVTRANDDLASPLTVDYSTSGTAVAGTNYDALTGSVTILSGQSSATISVQPMYDANLNEAATLTITLTSESSYSLGSQTSSTLSIENTDLPVITISAASPNVEENGSADLFTVTRTPTGEGDNSQPLTVTYTTSGSAVAGTNYSPLIGAVTIPAGQSAAMISLQPIDDDTADDSTTLQISLSADNNNYTLGTPSSASVSIDNVDLSPTSNPALITNPGISAATISNSTATSGSTTNTIDLSQIFTNPYLAGDTIVQMQTNQGTIYLELFNSQAPATVTNFLSYVNSGQYNNTLIYRAVQGFVDQTGADYPVDPNNNPITTSTPASTDLGNINTLSNPPTVENEYNDTRPNVTGTIAMAKQSGDPNSASTEWFINLGDNSENLDNQNGGFTVFGQVVGGMSVVQAIGNITEYNVGNGYDSFPLINPTGQYIEAGNLVLVPTMSVVPAFSYTVSSSNTAIVNPSLTGSDLSFVYGQSGTAQITVTATDVAGDTQSESFNVTVQPGAPARLALATQPASTTTGQTIPIAVNVVDQNGNLVTADNSQISLSLVNPPAGVTITGTPTATIQNGVATFSNISFSQPGTYTLEAIDNSDNLTIATQQFTVSAPAVNTAPSITSANAATFTVGTSGSFTFTSTGSPTATLTETGVLPAGLTFTPNSDGTATLSGTPAEPAGTYVITITAANGVLPDASQTFDLTLAPAAPTQIIDVATHLAFTTVPQTATSCSPFTVVVNVEDIADNIVTSDNSTVTLALASGTLGLGGYLTATAVNGVATFSNVILTGTGSSALTASDGSLANATSSAIAVSYAGPQLVIVQPPSSSAAGSKFALQVDTDNTSGQIVNSGKNKISLKVLGGPSGAKLPAARTITSKNGVANFSNLSFQKAGTYTLVFSTAGYASTQSMITIMPGALAKLAFNPQPANVASGSPFNVSVELFDRYGNLLTNSDSTVDLSLGAHPKGIGLSITPETPVDGVADFNSIVLDDAGPYSLQAIDGKIKVTSKKFTVSE